MTPEQAFTQTIEAQLVGEHAPAELEQRILAFGDQVAELSREQVAKIAARYRQRAELHVSATSRSSELPRLLVDWGQGVHVGSAACPAFHLVCPAEFQGQPHVEIEMDSRIDFAATAATPRLVNIDNGRLWSFDVPFSLTTNGEDCRSGDYRMQLSIRFRTAKATLPRYFRTSIRLSVKPVEDFSGTTLEIQGDGDSLLNLHGRDLKAFGKIIMKCSDRGVINVQELPDFSDESIDDNSPSSTAANEPTQHEYSLSVDHTRDERIPRVSHRFPDRKPTDRLTLLLPNDRRMHLLSKADIQLGRDRDNDVVLRCLPVTPENDAKSLNISRRHLKIALDDRGLCVEDQQSSQGSKFGDSVLKPLERLDAPRPREGQVLTLAPNLDAASQFQMGVFCYPLHAHNAASRVEEDESDLLEALELASSANWQTARRANLSAVKILRRDALSERESFLCVWHTVAIGAAQDCPISLDGHGLHPLHARLFHVDSCFWIENLASAGDTRVDGHALPRKELVPIGPGSTLKLGDVEVECAAWSQLHL